jgi:sulfatase maturation enzyme AslB (radical SAM superfamily)
LLEIIRISRETYNFERGLGKHTYWEKVLSNFDANLINNSVVSLDSQKILFKKYVELINLETSSFCNRSCVYCPDSKFPRDFKESLDNEIIVKILKELSVIDYSGDFSLNLYNEPLTDYENLKSIITLIKKELPLSTIGFNTNGDLLDLQKISELESIGVNRIKITIHPPANKKYDQIRETTRFNTFLKNLNANEDNFANTIDDNIAYFKFGKMFLILQSIDFLQLGTDRGRTIDTVIKTTRVAPCVKPMREFTIYYDGSVTQCCDAFYSSTYPKNKIGSVAGDSIFSIYCSQIFKTIRKELFSWGEKSSICKTCSSFDNSKTSENKIRKELLLQIERSDN